jgi:quercetin dioxygenase-like cupin family protein
MPFTGEGGNDSSIARRIVLQTIAALACVPSSALALAQAKPQPQGPKRVFQQDIPDLSLKNWAVNAVEVSYAPGQSSAAHKHPGVTIAYVLEGEVVSKLDDGPERTYRAGEMWLETPGQVHAVSRNASDTRPARLLAILLAEKGVQLTTPVK